MAGFLENAHCGPLFHGEDDEPERELGVIQGVSKSLVVANNMGGVLMYETVRVGVDRCLGEVIRLDGDTATIQLYEDVGDAVVRTRTPLSVELGPGILGQMYDGIQRPFEEMSIDGKMYLEKGVNIPALDQARLWEFVPQNFKIGDMISGGDIFGRVYETALVTHWIMLPPKAKGTITYIAPHGQYTITEEVLTVEFIGEKKSFTMMQKWPVRQPRPYDEKLACDTPLYTGVRVYDVLFPLAIGGTCVFPGAYGCGKGMTCQSVAKNSDSDVVVYAACGERGNELAEMLMEFPELTTVIGGVHHSLTKRMCIIGNTSNMPMASREASIYTGVTISEYFRDQGHNVTMIADSTSRWAEALMEISHRIPEMPASSGYPAYLGSRLASFYERAGKVSCIGNPARTGAVSILASVSPAGGDFSDPVCAATLSICQAFWALDKRLAQRKHFPSVNWLYSFSRYSPQLAPFFENIDSEYSAELAKIKEILELEDQLTEIVQIVGKDSLQDIDKLTLEVARIIRDDFLQQNMFSMYDRLCPPYKSAWMMKNITTFYALARRAVEQNFSIVQIKSSMGDVMRDLTRMKFQNPHDGQEALEHHMKKVNKSIYRSFCVLDD